jgi:hypothetical protein
MKKAKNIHCQVCSFELVEDDKKCECKLCEVRVGYLFLKCPECKIQYALPIF